MYSVNVSSSILANINCLCERRSSSFIFSDYSHTLDAMSSSCVLLGARLHLIPTLEPEMGTISHLIPRGPDRGTRSLPQVSLFNIWVLYSEAARRSEIYDQCSIRSMSHTHTKKAQTQTHTGPAIYGVSLGLLQWGEETETKTWTDVDSGRLLGDWGGEGEQKDGMRTIRQGWRKEGTRPVSRSDFLRPAEK